MLSDQAKAHLLGTTVSAVRSILTGKAAAKLELKKGHRFLAKFSDDLKAEITSEQTLTEQ